LAGKIEETGHNPGVANLLTAEESQESLKQAVKMWKVRNKLSDKIGKGQFALVVYEKLKRITIPFHDKHLIYITMGMDGGHADVVDDVHKLIPSETKVEPPKPASKPKVEELPAPKAEVPPRPKENKPELNDPNYWSSRDERLESYERDYLERLEKERKKEAKVRAVKQKEVVNTTHETLPKGFKPQPKPDPKPAKRSDRGSLPKGF